jgi:FkbM family methyltransferase
MATNLKSKINTSAAMFYNDFFFGGQKKRYLFGINEFSDAIASKVEVDGFIDEYTEMPSWRGKPIVRLSSVELGSLVVSCVTQARPKTAINKLIKAGVVSSIDYFAFADASEGLLPQVPAISDTRSDYKDHAGDYQWVREQLFDEESRNVFDCVMNFRLAGSLVAMEQFEYAADRQYFEPFVQLSKGEVFVDGGGFDGFTSLEFAARCPEYTAVHFFEPNQVTLALAKEKLSQLGRIYYHPLGLFDKAATLCFDSSSGSASHISDNGTEKIDVAKLDDVVLDAVSFIKLDLEGAEMAALRGMEGHILNDHPKLAVAVYHHPSDFWKVPRYILGLRNDYKVYLRHYTEGWTETVMFFIPKNI